MVFVETKGRKIIFVGIVELTFFRYYREFHFYTFFWHHKLCPKIISGKQCRALKKAIEAFWMKAFIFSFLTFYEKIII